jgi:hypothetical protein
VIDSPWKNGNGSYLVVQSQEERELQLDLFKPFVTHCFHEHNGVWFPVGPQSPLCNKPLALSFSERVLKLLLHTCLPPDLSKALAVRPWSIARGELGLTNEALGKSG